MIIKEAGVRPLQKQLLRVPTVKAYFIIWISIIIIDLIIVAKFS